MFSGQEFVIKGGDMNGPKKRVGVIGCGISGLVSIKTAMEYGHSVVGYERLADIGGIWNFQLANTREVYWEKPEDGFPCYPVYNSLVANTSRYTTMFSDFMPLEKSQRDFPTREEVGRYLQAYASHFNLAPRIKFRSHVSKLDKKGGKWYVHYRQEDEELVDEFDFVLVCTGGFGFPRQYDIKGKETFKGLILHSSQVRNGAELFKDKNVFLLGGAISAGEILSMALNNSVKKMYVNFTDRKKTASVWTVERNVRSVYGDRRPYDLCVNRENWFLNAPDAQVMFGQWLYPLQQCSANAQPKIPNDILTVTDVNAFKSAKALDVLSVVDSVEKVDGNSIYLCNGDLLEDIDIIVIAKGYDRTFPFLDHIWPRSEQAKYQLYNYIIPPAAQLDGLVFINMLITPSPGFPMAELQSRWFIHKIVPRAYNSDDQIFDANERKYMEECIDKKLSQLPNNFPFAFIDNSYLLNAFMAEDIGVNPPDFKELVASGDKKQLELGVALAYGPIYPMQYRIRGLHSMRNAAEKCITLTKEFLGEHFEKYLEQAKQNNYPRSGYLDPSNGPYNEY